MVDSAEKTREKMRKFVFEELLKVDPDAISFSRPDSGSGIFDEEDSDDAANEDD